MSSPRGLLGSGASGSVIALSRAAIRFTHTHTRLSGGNSATHLLRISCHKPIEPLPQWGLPQWGTWVMNIRELIQAFARARAAQDDDRERELHKRIPTRTRTKPHGFNSRPAVSEETVDPGKAALVSIEVESTLHSRPGPPPLHSDSKPTPLRHTLQTQNGHHCPPHTQARPLLSAQY